MDCDARILVVTNARTLIMIYIVLAFPIENQ
jgi:hypothetical protein